MLGLATAAVVVGGVFASVGGTASAADCSRATALRIGEPFFFDPASRGNPISQVLCGPFTGAGSEAMAVSFAAPTCWGIQRWAVFRVVEGDWQLVLDRKGFVFPLVAVGADIREKAPVFRPGDPRCLPSGGSRARLWRWNGTRFTPGPWKQVTPGAAAPAVPGFSGFFKPPSGNVVCGYGYGSKIPRAFVGCRIKSGLKPRHRGPSGPGASRPTMSFWVRRAGRRPDERSVRASPRAMPASWPMKAWRGCSATARRGAAVV